MYSLFMVLFMILKSWVEVKMQLLLDFPSVGIRASLRRTVGLLSWSLSA